MVKAGLDQIKLTHFSRLVINHDLTKLSVLNISGGVIYKAGSCLDTTIKVFTAGLADCEVECLNNINCKAATVTALTTTSFRCELKNTSCSSMAQIPSTTTLLVQGKLYHYHILHEFHETCHSVTLILMVNSHQR